MSICGGGGGGECTCLPKTVCRTVEVGEGGGGSVLVCLRQYVELWRCVGGVSMLPQTVICCVKVKCGTFA